MLKNLKQPELYKYYIIGSTIVIMVAFTFFNSYIAAFLLSPFVIFYVNKMRLEEVRKREELLAKQFKDGIIAVSFSLGVGYSIENAFREATREMVALHGEDSIIVREFMIICNRLSRNENIEEILEDFANKSRVEDIKYFAEVFKYAKRSGGDLIAISRNTARVITEKNEVQNDINTIISGKKMEQNIMNIIPFVIILYLRFTSPEFIMPLYNNLFGVFIMIICLGLYVFSIYIGNKITDIKI